MTYSPRTRELQLKRNTYTHPSNTPVSLNPECNVLVRVTVASFDDTKVGCDSYHKCSGLLRLTLNPDEQQTVLQLDMVHIFSLYVSVHIAVVPPNH